MPTSPFTFWTSVLVLLVACSSGSISPRDASHLPPYTGDEVSLFSDSLSRAIFGLPREGLAPADDPSFSRRVLQADSVAAVKVATIASDNNGVRPMYHLVLRPQGRPLAGVALGKGPIEVDVGERDPAVALLHASGGDLSGSSLIVFLKRYKDRGQAVLHFHAEPDSAEVRAAIANVKR